MIFSSPPPQFGQCSMSMSKTRLSSRAQLMLARSRLRGLNFAIGDVSSSGGRLCLCGRFLRHHQRAQLGVGGQHPMKTDQVQPRPRHQCGQPLHELQRAHDQVRGPVAPRRLELDLMRGLRIIQKAGIPGLAAALAAGEALAEERPTGALPDGR